MLETKNDTYVDDLIVQTDYSIPNHFRNIFNQNSEIFGTDKYENLFDEVEDNDEKNVDNDNDNSLVKIVVGTIVGVICVGVLIFLLYKFVLRKRKPNLDEKGIEEMEMSMKI